jgi:flagellin-like protein
MELKQLFTSDEENRAVSPVIGVILMVAITVILAAVIGTFVLGLGDQVQQTSPNAQWNWEVESNDDLTLTHEGGDSVDAARLSLSGDGYGGSNGQDLTNSATAPKFSNDEVTAGVSLTITSSNLNSDSDVSLVWTASGGGQSSTLTTYEYSP